jgi:hypothetical protein
MDCFARNDGGNYRCGVVRILICGVLAPLLTDIIAWLSTTGFDMPMPRSLFGWTNASMPGSDTTGSADADDASDAATKAARPNSLNLIIALSLP